MLFSEDTFSHLTWWWYGGLRAPPVTRFGSFTAADLGIFYAHSKPFWFDPVRLWELPVGAHQSKAENAVILWNFPRTFWKPLGFWKEWFLSLKPERCLFETFHAWRLFKLFWCDPVSRDRRVAQKRPITRSLRSTQGQWLDCHDSSSNKANSSEDQNMSISVLGDHHCKKRRGIYGPSMVKTF